MLLRPLPEKGNSSEEYKMKQEKLKRDCTVLTEKISPEKVAVMAELIAMRETKALIGFMGYHAEKAHKQLCRDIFGKDESGYTFSDNYELVQNVALFLCGHYGEYLDDVLYISKKGKRITIKTECYRIITRMLAGDYRIPHKHQSLEVTKEKAEPEYEQQINEEQDYTRVDEIGASLNLTENMSLALDYRMSGLSYPEIAKLLSRAVSTVYEYFEKRRARYSAIYG